MSDRLALPGGLTGIDAAILAGGLGTRLRGVLGEVPKVLAPVAGRAFRDDESHQWGSAVEREADHSHRQ